MFRNLHAWSLPPDVSGHDGHPALLCLTSRSPDAKNDFYDMTGEAIRTDVDTGTAAFTVENPSRRSCHDPRGWCNVPLLASWR